MRHDRYPNSYPRRQTRYRTRRKKKPMLSWGFTAFLIVLALAAVGLTVYIVASTYPGVADIVTAPGGDTSDNQANNPANTPQPNDNAGNAYEGTANETEVPNTYDPNEYATGDNTSYNYANEGGYNGGAEEAVPTAAPNANTPDSDTPEQAQNPPQNSPYETYESFTLLTTVDNSMLPWYLKLVNRYNFLDYYFMPYLTAIGGGHYFDSRAYRALLDMLASAREEGLSPIVISSFRSVSRQTTLFNNRIQRFVDQGYNWDDAFEAARRIVAYPGTSEHNLGLAVDIVAQSYQNLTANFGSTPEGIWLAENAHRYGLILRYPYHKQHITNIIYEPWHFRYVGIEAATEMFYRDLVLEEFVSEILATR